MELLRPRKQGGGGERPRHDTGPDCNFGLGGRRLRCVQCRNPITTPEARSLMGGRHQHVFCNPHGVVFELEIYQQAPGCAAMGPDSTEFTWFPGYAWRVAVCRNCLQHLGWLFSGTAGQAAFWGLISGHLVEE